MGGLIEGVMASKLLGPIIGGVAIFAVGFGAAEIYEHRAPWSLAHQRDHLRDVVVPQARKDGEAAGIKSQAAADKAAFNKWDAALKACRDAAKAARDAEAAKIAAADKFTSAQASAAYRLGRASCGAHDANPNPPPGPVAALGVLRDDTDFASAFGGSAAPPTR